PKLNNMLKPKSSEKAPNHADLKRGWMSAKEYYGLPDKKPKAEKKSAPKERTMSARDYYGPQNKAA
ncbi:MAG: hypothetical protein AAGB16_06895, partial [Pseudomonadota bacterium]